ncbi:TetR/AcrR family transcriptional regulator [Microbacterium sp. NPDC056234]|uniref:TetR/AcrR family transcriptional regulator n=1 Tax=Microbacterium sp. NPDC056234 TaxID=3345757 RepID=UPI0035DF6A16
MRKSAASRESIIPLLAEAFRDHGYEGASMAVLESATGLGRGSLYNFFPGGKEMMAEAVLDDVDRWFYERIFTPLLAGASGVETMFDGVDSYFRSGRRVCLQGMFALGRERDRFALTIRRYFSDWVEALTYALRDAGLSEPHDRAVRVVAGIQGGLVIARALDSPDAFAVVLKGARRDAGC